MKHIAKPLGVLLSVLLALSVFAAAAFAADAPAGTVTFSMVDFGDRTYLSDLYEDEICHPEPYGVILPATEVAFYEGETLADVAERWLTEAGVPHTASSQYGWALSTVDFTAADGTEVTGFGGGSITPDDDYLTPFSGWMVAVNNCFGSGLSYYPADDGDVVEFEYTCEMGADIRGDFYRPSAAVTDLKVEGGTLTPAFDAATKAYTLKVAFDTASVKVAAALENRNATTTYTADGTEYKYLRAIPVENGTVITVKTEAVRYDNTTWEVLETLTDEYTITVEKEAAPEEPAAEEPEEELSFWARVKAFFARIGDWFKALFEKIRAFFVR